MRKQTLEEDREELIGYLARLKGHINKHMNVMIKDIDSQIIQIDRANTKVEMLLVMAEALRLLNTRTKEHNEEFEKIKMIK